MHTLIFGLKIKEVAHLGFDMPTHLVDIFSCKGDLD